MEVRPTPRQMAKGLLNGVTTPRPLFLPILFSLGARVENTALGTFLGSPTKISNSLRQMHNQLRTDAVCCYFDPYLEAEALGATVERAADDQPSIMRWPRPAKSGELPGGLRSAEEAVQGGRIPVAVEVIRRMSSLPNREFLLMARVTGPITLAALLAQIEPNQNFRAEDITVEAQELSASVVTQVATTMLEAGADLIVIQEERLPVFSAESCEAWANLLAPTINVIRFYEALPVLQLANAIMVYENWNLILRQSWDCVVCMPMEIVASRKHEESLKGNDVKLGIALPRNAFRSGGVGPEDLLETLRSMVSGLQPAVIMTASDIPHTTDMKCLIRVLSEVPRAF